MIVCLMVMGVYTVNNTTFDLYFMIAFGLIGYFMNKRGVSSGAAGSWGHPRRTCGTEPENSANGFPAVTGGSSSPTRSHKLSS